jgi:hypothetical protein
MGDQHLASALRLKANQVRNQQKAEAEAKEAREKEALDTAVADAHAGIQNTKSPAELAKFQYSLPNKVAAAVRTALTAQRAQFRMDATAATAAAKVKGEEDVATWATKFNKEYDGHLSVYTKARGGYLADPTKHAELHGGKEMDMLDVFLAQVKSIETAPANVQAAMRERAQKDYAAAMSKLGPGPKVTTDNMSPQGWEALERAAKDADNDPTETLARMLEWVRQTRTPEALRDFRVVKSLLTIGMGAGAGAPQAPWLGPLLRGVEEERNKAGFKGGQ